MRFKEHSLNEYRRHAPDCKLSKPSDMNCHCPLWAVGRVHGKRFRRSLGTRNRQKARAEIHRLLGEKPDTPPAESAPTFPTVAGAVADYLRFCEFNKRLQESTLTSYRDTFHAFEQFAKRRLYRTLDQFSLNVFEEFQAERKVTPKTMAKEFQHLTSFCARNVELGWLKTNFAKKVKLPKADDVSTWPFREGEAEAILEACDRLGAETGGRGGYASYSAEQLEQERAWARALVLVLLSTALRISDAVNLQKSRLYIDQGATRLRLRAQKNGVWVTLRLPFATTQALEKLPRVSDELFFWNGGDERQFATACDRARRVIARLGDLAGVKDAHPHRFRDTWAKEALLAGRSLRDVQLVLGHKSIRTTEKHYAPYVPEYQQTIDAATDAVAARLIA